MESVSIGIWGPKDSGKTTYLTMLPYVEEKLEWRLTPANEETADYLNKNFDNLTYRGEPVVKTVKSSPVRLSFNGIGPQKFLSPRRCLLEVPDVRGEVSVSANEEIIEYLKNCSGILWFIDPDGKLPPIDGRDPEFSYRKLIFDTLAKLYARVNREKRLLKSGLLPHYMAFCMTKMDQPQHYQAIKDRIPPREYLQRILGRYWITDVRRFCETEPEPRYEAFYCSALGLVKTREGSIMSNFDGTHIIDPEHIEPIDIELPLKWILDRVT